MKQISNLHIFQTATIVSLLSLVSIICSLPLNGAESTWLTHGNYDISWYNTSSTTFELSTPQQVAGVAYLMDNGYTTFSGKTITLTDDIDLSAHIWMVASSKFCGTLNGNFKEISGLTLTLDSHWHDGSSNYFFGMFAKADGVTVKDLVISGTATLSYPTYAFTGTYCGAIAGYSSNCTFTNCVSNFDIEYERSETYAFAYKIYLGGMTGYSNSCTFEYCTHNGDMSAQIRGTTDQGSYVHESICYMGGIVGYEWEGSILYCVNNSDLMYYRSLPSKNSAVFFGRIGGIAGNGSLTNFEGCANHTKKFQGYYAGSTSVQPIWIGGIVGSGYYDKFDKRGHIFNCYSTNNEIDVSGSPFLYGGITAYGNYESSSDRYKACYSPSDISAGPATPKTSSAYNGNTSFSADEMNSDEFLGELNLYPMLNGLEYEWISDGEYPVVKNPYNVMGIESIEISPSVVELQIDGTHTVNAIITPEDVDATLSWRSEDESVAQVTPSGRYEATVKGILAGETTIWVETSTGEKASCAVTVKSVKPTAISLPSSLTLKYGATAWLTPEIEPAGAVTDILWSSSNEGVATVSDQGQVAAVGEGNATVTAETAVGGLTASCRVTVMPKPLYFVTELNGGALIVMEMANEPKVVRNSEWLTIEDETAAYSYLATEVHKFYMDWVNEGNSAADALADRFSGAIRLAQGEILLQGFAPDTEVCVYSLGGILMERRAIPVDGSLSIQTSAYAPGTYIVKADNNTLKFIKK